MQGRTYYKYYFKINTFYKINIQSKTNLQKINTNKTIQKNLYSKKTCKTCGLVHETKINRQKRN